MVSAAAVAVHPATEALLAVAQASVAAAVAVHPASAVPLAAAAWEAAVAALATAEAVAGNM